MKSSFVVHKYLKVNDGIVTFAKVQLKIEPNDLETNRILLDSERIPFRSQGQNEAGYDNWNLSAKNALEIASSNIISSPKLDIVIKKLEGRIFLDTNNASIGVACILGLWEYFEIKPENELMEKIHAFVKADWDNEINIIPDFSRIFII